MTPTVNQYWVSGPIQRIDMKLHVQNVFKNPADFFGVGAN